MLELYVYDSQRMGQQLLGKLSRAGGLEDVEWGQLEHKRLSGRRHDSIVRCWWKERRIRIKQQQGRRRLVSTVL